MAMTAPFLDRAGLELYRGDHADDAAALAYCAANSVNLAGVDLRGRTLDGANISGLWAPGSDWAGASARGVTANRAVNGRICELSAAALQGAVFTGATLTVANLACTHPTSFRAETGQNTRLRGVDWSDCPDVIELPVSRRERDRVGRVIVLRNGTGWKVHAGARGVLAEADARTQFAANADYAAALAYLDTPECAARKAAIEGQAGATIEAEAKAR